MKSSKGTSLKGKRKLTDMEIHQPTVVGARRTRSSSNADNVYTQRSTRSTCGNAFFELPNNYGSRKSQNGMYLFMCCLIRPRSGLIVIRLWSECQHQVLALNREGVE